VQQITLDGAAWVPPRPTNQLDVQVLALLHDGHVHHRHSLSIEVGADVRPVCVSVSRLRVLGWPICLGPNRGDQLLWRPEDLDALERKHHSQVLASFARSIAAAACVGRRPRLCSTAQHDNSEGLGTEQRGHRPRVLNASHGGSSVFRARRS
jgi:hypothetical protein